MNTNLLEKLKSECQKALSRNTRFHDYGHALEVLENTQKILQFETGDEETLLAAALFHDISNESGSNEGEDGACLTRQILSTIPDFPQNKIEDVCRLIKSISGKAEKPDELIINEADRMAIFSKLSLARAFMIYGQKGIQPKEAIEDFLEFIERKYKKFKLPKAKELIQDDYLFLKNFLSESLKSYT